MYKSRTPILMTEMEWLLGLYVVEGLTYWSDSASLNCHHHHQAAPENCVYTMTNTSSVVKYKKGGVPKKGCAKEHSVCRYSKDCAQYSVGYLKCACYRFKQRWAVLCPFVFPIPQIVASAIFRSTQHPPPYPPRTSTSAESLEGIFRGCFSSLFLSDAMESQSRVSLWKHFSFSKNNKNVVLVDFVQGTSSPSFAWDFFLFLPTEKNNTEDIIILTCRERMEYKGGAMLYVDWDVTQPSILWFDEC